MKKVISVLVIVAMLIVTPVSAYANSLLIDEDIALSEEYCYTGSIIGTGVRFRSSPAINSTNIIRTFDYGERIYVYNSGLNCAYADGYTWSYVFAVKDDIWGYVASKYFATECIPRSILADVK